MFTLTLTIADDVYARAQLIAEETAQPIERVLENYLKTLSASPTLSADVQAELDALHYLSTDALLTIAQARIAPEMEGRLQSLLDLEVRSLKDAAELVMLLERADRLTLRKAESMVLLNERDYLLYRDVLI